MALGEDAALLPRLRAGDEAAFRELVRRHHGRRVRLAGAFTGGRARAEEAVQYAWVVVVTSLDGYSGEAPLGAWIAGIVVNPSKRTGGPPSVHPPPTGPVRSSQPRL